MHHERQIDSLRRTSSTFEQALVRAAGKLNALRLEGGALESAAEPGNIESPAFDALIRGTTQRLTKPEDFSTTFRLEAVVLAELRPAYLIKDNQIQIDGNYDRLDRLSARKSALERVCRSVGRVDLLNHQSEFAGTGWLVDRNTVVTNRHVAARFGQPSLRDGWEFLPGRFGRPVQVEIDPSHQHDTHYAQSSPPLQVTQILYIAEQHEPDIAFLRVDPEHAHEPVELSTGLVAPETPVAAVGYPAADPMRNDPLLMGRLFDDIYDVKRFSPGLCTAYDRNDTVMLADYTTLGGSSGSAVIDIETGKAVALHFAGLFQEANYALPADLVAAALRDLKSSVSVADSITSTEETPARNLFSRAGFDSSFLGCGTRSVQLPALGCRGDDVAPVSGTKDNVLRYTHFSVIQSLSRRLPMLTAVNIDGAAAFRLKRRGSWRLDGRLQAEHQIGNALYVNNVLDRGHMVRRMDPGWGATREEAQQGEIDTFHYTNAAPQHKELNQRDWVDLEDYILESATTLDFKVSVMTGPVFRDSDKPLKHQPGAEDIRIPEHFWKIAVMINADTGELSATGYLLTQGELIRDLTEAAFVLGAYRTYQVKISRIAQLTGFDFHDLEAHDPLRLEQEGIFGRAVTAVAGPDSLRL